MRRMMRSIGCEAQPQPARRIEAAEHRPKRRARSWTLGANALLLVTASVLGAGGLPHTNSAHLVAPLSLAAAPRQTGPDIYSGEAPLLLMPPWELQEVESDVPPADMPPGPYCAGLPCGTQTTIEQPKDTTPTGVPCLGLGCGDAPELDAPAKGNPSGSVETPGLLMLIEPDPAPSIAPPDADPAPIDDSLRTSPGYDPNPFPQQNDGLAPDTNYGLPPFAVTPVPPQDLNPAQWWMGMPGEAGSSCSSSMSWNGASGPNSTANPVDFASGHKLEGATDLVVPLVGRDFVLARSYTSQLLGSSAQSLKPVFPNLSGAGWMLNVTQQIVADNISPINGAQSLLVPLPQGMTRFVYKADADPPSWRPVGASDQYIVKATAPAVDATGNAAGTVPVWRLVDPGSFTQEFLRALEAQDSGATEPGQGRVGLLHRIVDTYGNARAFSYKMLVLGDTNSIRLETVFLDRSQGSGNPTLRFTWSTGSGRLEKAEVFRTAATGTPVCVSSVQYRYASEGETHLGSVGDLVEVCVSHLVDPSLVADGDNWHRTITQYRYHTGDQANYVRGQKHQLKAVILPSMIESGAQASAQGGTIVNVQDFSSSLLARPDGQPAWESAATAPTVRELFSKLVSYEMDGQRRVKAQFLLTGCPCAGTGSHSTRLAYQYTQWNQSGSNFIQGVIRRQVRIREEILSESSFDPDATDGQIKRTTYIDLSAFRRQFVGAGQNPQRTLDYHLVRNTVTGVPVNGVERFWVTQAAYVPSFAYSQSPPSFVSWNMHEVRGPECFESYSPGTAGGGTQPPATPLTTPRESGASYWRYGYLDGRLTTATMMQLGVEVGTLVRQIRYRPGSPWLVAQIEFFRKAGSFQSADISTVRYEYRFSNPSDPSSPITQVTIVSERDLVEENGDAGAGGTSDYRTTRFYDPRGREACVLYPDDTLVVRGYTDETGAVKSVTSNAAVVATPTSWNWDQSLLDGTYRNSDGGSLTWQYEYDIVGRVRSATDPSGVHRRYYREMSVLNDHGGAGDGRPGLRYLRTISLPDVRDGVANGGAKATWMTASGSTIATVRYEMASNSQGSFDAVFPSYGLSLGAMRSRSTVQQNIVGDVVSQIVWHSLEGKGDGGGYYQTRYTYDGEGRLHDVIDPNGNITRRTYDALGRVASIQSGVEGQAALVTDSEYFYDGGTATDRIRVGAGHLTLVRGTSTDENANDGVAVRYTHDARGRLTSIQSSSDEVPSTYLDYDNLNRVVRSATYRGNATHGSFTDANEGRLSLVTLNYSQRGFVYSTLASTAPKLGDASPTLASFIWRDSLGRTVATWGASGPATKYRYDGLGRTIATWTTDRGGDAAPGTGDSLASASNIDGDTVFDSLVQEYPYTTNGGVIVANGLPALTIGTGRHHRSTQAGLTADTSIASYSAVEFDQFARPVRSRYFGTNQPSGFVAGGATNKPSFDTTSRSWSAATGVKTLDTEYRYDTLGRADRIVTAGPGDIPTTIVTKVFFDDMGREVAVAENWKDASISWDQSTWRWKVSGMDPTKPDEDRVTSTTHRLVPTPASPKPYVEQVVHYLKTGSWTESIQVTRYEFGLETEGEFASPRRSNSLLSRVLYPRRTTTGSDQDGLPNPADSVVSTYDRAGRLKKQRDQRGVTHEFVYDQLGRITENIATGGGTDVDDWMDRVRLEYEPLTGRLKAARSLKQTSPGSFAVLNAVQFGYDPDSGLLSSMLQNPVGDITVGGGGAPTGTTKEVRYQYALSPYNPSATSSTEHNFIRLGGTAYPSGDVLGVGYGPANSLDSRVSRPRALTVSGGTAVQYSYFGFNTPVVVDYPTPDIQLDYSVSHNGSSSATAYPALDTFGRTRRILWKDGAFAPGSTAGEPSRPPLVELAYAFDHASNLVAKADARHGSSRKRDEQYTLDGLMRLLKARRGDFTGADPAPGAFVAAPGTQKYQYDFVGNIRSTDILANASEQQSASDRKLTASFNAVNEQTNYVETVGGGGSLGATFAITHDAAGNVRTRETVAGGNRLAYRHDRWGRLTEVKFEVRSGSSYLANDRARYRYNALGMRALVERDADTTDPTNAINERRYLYYNAAWQIVEEHVDAGVTSTSSLSIDRIVQNVWGLRYIDDLVLRRVDANYLGSSPPSFAETASGDIDWEQYLTDHQFSVVAAVGRTGALAFRVAYDAYGEARHLPAKDINGDGKVDSADTAIAQAASGRKLGAAGYNPDADWDRDGTVTSTDIAQFGSRSYAAALPQGQLAQPGSATQPAAGDVSPSANLARAANARSDFNIGFSGYRFNGDIGAYTVRFRHYDPTPGMCRWLERDPAGYQDGPSLYSYLGRNPMAGTDPYGLASDDGVWHHIIPQEFADEVKRYFGDDFLNSTENGLILPKDVHQELHGDGYNRDVRIILDDMKKSGKLQGVDPDGKNARQLQEANRKQFGDIRNSIKKVHGAKMAKGTKALVSYSQWGKRRLSKGFFAKMKALGKKAAFNGTRLPAALVFAFIASALTDSMAESAIQTTQEYATLMQYYDAGNIDRISGAVDEVVLRIRLMGNQYNDYADQFEEIWKQEIIPNMCANP